MKLGAVFCPELGILLISSLPGFCPLDCWYLFSAHRFMYGSAHEKQKYICTADLGITCCRMRVVLIWKEWPNPRLIARELKITYKSSFGSVAFAKCHFCQQIPYPPFFPLGMYVCFILLKSIKAGMSCLFHTLLHTYPHINSKWLKWIQQLSDFSWLQDLGALKKNTFQHACLSMCRKV